MLPYHGGGMRVWSRCKMLVAERARAWWEKVVAVDPSAGGPWWWTLRTERVTLMGERPRREPFSPTYPMSRGVYHEQ